MPHRAESRTGGRHREELLHRHRAPRGSLVPAAATERGRTTMLGATLSAALLAGVAAGGTAATASSSDPTWLPISWSPTSGSTAAEPAASGSTTSEPAASGSATAGSPALRSLPPSQAADRVAAKASPPAAADQAGEPHVSADLGAVRVARKDRPVGTPAWVNPNPSAAVTSCFGPRWGRLHAGVDLAAPSGTPIVAAGAGVVVRAGVAEGYGNAVLIDHGNGYLTHYGHLATITVTAGQRVATGRQVGTEGSTGHSTGPHLHFEVHQGYYQNPVEPTRWMREHGVEITGCTD